MKLFLVLFLTCFYYQSLYAKQDNRKFYEERANFIKNYISIIKKERKKNKNFKGTIVESLDGKIFTRYGSQTQKKLDDQALLDCKNGEGVECLVRFRTLKKNLKYNRLAQYINSKKKLKVLGEYMSAKKVYSAKEIDIFINIKNFENKNGFGCTKSESSYREIINVLRKEIELYPRNFLKKSGLKYVVICEKITDRNIDFEPTGIALSHYDKSPGVFYLNLSAISKINTNKVKKIKEVFHHEFYHIIDSSLSLIILDEKWNKINEQEYLEEYLIDGSGIDNSTKGYISKYSRSNAAEDKAELFAYMIVEHKEFKKIKEKDEILFKKSKLMISRLKSISKDMDKNFWKKLN